MKKIISIFLLAVTIIGANILQVNGDVPYYTYTGRTNGGITRTSDAYYPSGQISSVNGIPFKQIQHVQTDQNDHLYITDTTLMSVFILDENYNYVGQVSHPELVSPFSSFVTKDKIYVVDALMQTIFVFDKFSYELIQKIGKPNSPIFDGKSGYKFNPQEVAVDNRGNIYVKSAGSKNGLIMLNSDGEFITFFGGNKIRVPLLTGIRKFFLTEEQVAKMEMTPPDYISSVTIDSKGFLYTVSSSLQNNAIKKLNPSGMNYFEQGFGVYGLNSIAVGKYNNVFVSSDNGYILEYDRDGNLLFFFGGRDITASRDGLLSLPVAITVKNNDELVVADQGRNIVQLYKPTEFANRIHQALDMYQNGKYDIEKNNWTETLEYNSVFDLARIGLGRSLLREGNYAEAYEHYGLAVNQEGISDVFKEMRQVWLENNLSFYFLLAIFIYIGFKVNKYISRKTKHNEKIKKSINEKVRSIKLIDDLLYVFYFLRHPFDGYYDLKRSKHGSVLSATVLYGLTLGAYIFFVTVSSDIFIYIKNYNIVNEIIVYLYIFGLGLASSYLVCQINEGEGTFKNMYIAFAYALSPIILFLPIVAIISNGLTLQESVFYTLPIIVMQIWTCFLVFFMIKDVHNYEVGETFKVILKTFFTMLIISIFLFVVSSLAQNILTLISDILREALLR